MDTICYGYCFHLRVLGTMSVPKCLHITTGSHCQLQARALSHKWHPGMKQILNTLNGGLCQYPQLEQVQAYPEWT